MKREEHFEVGERPELLVTAASSEIVLKEGAPGAIDVVLEGSEAGLESFDVTNAGDRVSIRLRKVGGLRWLQSSVAINVTLPPGTDIEIKTASGDLFASVQARSLAVSSASGDVRFGPSAERAKIKTASGDVALDEITGDLEAASASGDFSVEVVSGDLAVSTASGDLIIGAAGGRTVAKTASGDVRIDRFEGSSLSVVSMSGDVVVGLAPGMRLDADIKSLSGEFFNRVTPSGEEPTKKATLDIRTMSGDITLR